MTTTTRAKFRCNTVEQTSSEPTPILDYKRDGSTEPTGESTWPRTYRFSAVCDDGTPENERYARYTPIGNLTIQVDNPNVVFEPGRDYYLDFTPADARTEE